MAVRPRGNGWQADVSHKGQRYRADLPSREAAELWEAEAKVALLAGRPLPKAGNSTSGGENPAGGWTVSEGVDRTEKRFWKGTAGGPSAMHNAKFVLEFFGQKRRLSSISTTDVDDFVSFLEDRGDADGTINRKLAVLSKVLRFAKERGGLTSELPKIDRKKEKQGRIRYLTEDEEAAFLATLKAWGKDDHHDAFVVLIDTGVRLGELWRIEARDLNSKGGVVSIWRTKADLPRSIPMTKRVREVLERRTKKSPSGPLFPFDNAWFRYTWDRVRNHMGLDRDKQFIPHTLRHTTASRLVQRGVGIKVVQEWLGHRTITVTMRYAHLAPTNLQAAVSVLEART